MDNKWQRVIIPMLLLWAGGHDDVWSISRSTVAFALPLFIDYNEGLNSSMMDFDEHSAIISVVRTCP